MAKKHIELEIVDKTTGKKLTSFRWPIMPLKKIDESNLTKEQKTTLKNAIKEQIKTAKSHFKDGAWNLSARFYYDEVVESLLGFSLSDMFITQLCSQVNVTYTYNNGEPLFVNNVPKVFYSQVRNKMYVDTRARDVDYDVQLGDL